MKTEIVRAHAADYAEVLALLSEVNLPPEGVQEHLSEFLVARDAVGKLVGCVGQERYGHVALLRSLAVKPWRQGNGLGRELILELLSDARAKVA
jgi:amino-acid N-acetyltransferase